MNNPYMKLTSKHGWVGLYGAKTRGPYFNRLYEIDTASMTYTENYSTGCECVMSSEGLIGIIYSKQHLQNLMPRIKEFI